MLLDQVVFKRSLILTNMTYRLIRPFIIDHSKTQCEQHAEKLLASVSKSIAKRFNLLHFR
jgi:hypothetical protein